MIFDKVIHRWLCHDSLGRVIEPLAIYSKERNGYPISDLLKNLLHLRFYKRKIRHKTFLKERETAAAFFFSRMRSQKKEKPMQYECDAIRRFLELSVVGCNRKAS